MLYTKYICLNVEQKEIVDNSEAPSLEKNESFLKLTREEALKLCEEDNKLKYDTLKNFSEIIGFNLDNVLSKVSCIEKLY